MKKTDNSRATAIKILAQIILDGAYANIALNHELRNSRLSPRDKGFVTALVYGNLEKWQPVSYQLDKLLRKPLKKKDQLLGLILRNAIYEMLYCNVPPRAAVNEGVELAGALGHQGWRGLANGVLRNFSRSLDSLTWPEFAGDLEKAAFFSSLPAWITAMWREERGEEAALSLVKKLSENQPIAFRVNKLKATKEDIMRSFAAKGFTLEEGSLAPDCLLLNEGGLPFDEELFTEGCFSVQGEGSQLAVLALNPQSGEEVLDMCAAPGGKTAYIGELMGNRGEIYAGDVHDHKIKLIENACDRLGIDIVKAVKKQGQLWGQEYPGYFDCILLDAPCSGLGVLSQRQDALFRKDSGDIKALAAIQRELINSAIKALKPGGRLVYSTCTLSQRENLDNRNYILEEFPMKPVNLGYIAQGVDDEDAAALEQGYIELLPYKHHTDGFFIAAFTKEDK